MPHLALDGRPGGTSLSARPPVRGHTLTHTRPYSMINRFRALVVAVLATTTGSLHAQSAPPSPDTAAPLGSTSPASEHGASPIAYDRTGVGDTSIFAPIEH